MPYDVSGVTVTPITKERCLREFPRLYQYLLPWIARFEARSMFRREADPEFPWALSGPTDHLTDRGALVFIRYLASGGRPAAAVSEPLLDTRIGRTTLPYPNNKSNIYYTPFADEGYYLAAAINSEPAQRGLGRFAVSTGVTPAALERLPIPRYSKTEAAHRDLARLGRAAHQKREDPAQLAGIEEEIDEAVWSVTGG